MKWLLCFFFLAGCASIPEGRAPAAVRIRPFVLESKGYSLSGQINEVSGATTVALFFHGSGIHDRWETMPAEDTLDGVPAPIFKPISEAMNSRGISTVVFDKRGFREKGTAQADAAAKTATFENIKADAVRVLEHVEALGSFKKIILVGHSEGTVVASELDFDRKADPFLDQVILIGVLAENLKNSLRYQLVEGMADRTFASADKNGDGKIDAEEIPASMKAGLPIEKIDIAGKGFIARVDLLRVLVGQFNQLLTAIEKAPPDLLIMNKPVQWYRELIQRKSLLKRAGEYVRPVAIFHGELDGNVPYRRNAVVLTEAISAAGRAVSLKSFPRYGHCLSPEKNQMPTLGPIQDDAVQSIVFSYQ